MRSKNKRSGVLQFTPTFVVCYVLHRPASRVIHRLQLYCISQRLFSDCFCVVVRQVGLRRKGIVSGLGHARPARRVANRHPRGTSACVQSTQRPDIWGRPHKPTCGPVRARHAEPVGPPLPGRPASVGCEAREKSAKWPRGTSATEPPRTKHRRGKRHRNWGCTRRRDSAGATAV